MTYDIYKSLKHVDKLWALLLRLSVTFITQSSFFNWEVVSGVKSSCSTMLLDFGVMRVKNHSFFLGHSWMVNGNTTK